MSIINIGNLSKFDILDFMMYIRITYFIDILQ